MVKDGCHCVAAIGSIGLSFSLMEWNGKVLFGGRLLFGEEKNQETTHYLRANVETNPPSQRYAA